MKLRGRTRSKRILGKLARALREPLSARLVGTAVWRSFSYSSLRGSVGCMEAAGIEPASEESNRPASTCLVHYLISDRQPPVDRVSAFHVPEFLSRPYRVSERGIRSSVTRPVPDRQKSGGCRGIKPRELVRCLHLTCVPAVFRDCGDLGMLQIDCKNPVEPLRPPFFFFIPPERMLLRASPHFYFASRFFVQLSFNNIILFVIFFLAFRKSYLKFSPISLNIHV